MAPASMDRSAVALGGFIPGARLSFQFTPVAAVSFAPSATRTLISQPRVWPQWLTCFGDRHHPLMCRVPPRRVGQGANAGAILLPQAKGSRQMPTPYNLKIEDHCTDCSMRKNRAFCNMSAAAVAGMDSVKFTGVYPKGSLLFVEGEAPRGVFILCNGRAKLTTTSSEGRTLIVKIAGPGELLGASAAILDKPYELSGETLEPSQVNFIRRDDFLRLLSSHSEACMHTADQLSEKYSSAQPAIRTLGLAQITSVKLAM